MLDFMDYVQHAFYAASHWNNDNFYGTLTATNLALLDFTTPKGLRFNVSSLSTPNSATSYTLSNRGVVDGSLSFLYSSIGLRVPSSSNTVNLKDWIRGYRYIAELRRSDEPSWWEIWQKGKRVDRKDALLYGRLYLPGSTLEGLYLRRISPTRTLRLSCVSDSMLPNGGAILALLQNDYGKYSTEYLYSTDSSLLGVRGLYNFGRDPRKDAYEPGRDTFMPSTTIDPSPILGTTEPQHGRLSAGAEAYFSPINKSGGVSTAIRFTTLPSHTSFPYTMTLTVNPLMGNVSSGYAVKAGPDLSLCSRFDFNFYSYESDVQVGMELWKRKHMDPETAWARRMIRPDWQQGGAVPDDYDGVLKAKVDQNWKMSLLWEGRIKEVLVSFGAGLDLKKRDQIVGSVGLEFSYSS